jgi:hypothetical protein
MFDGLEEKFSPSKKALLPTMFIKRERDSWFFGCGIKGPYPI